MKIRKSYISALIIAGLVVGWMFSDDIVGFYGKVDLLEDHVALSETIEKEENLPNLITQALKVVNQRVPIQITARGVTRTGFDINVISR